MSQKPSLRLKVITYPAAPWRTARRTRIRPVRSSSPADDFDRLLDIEARRLSEIHWTPARVCRRAAQLLALLPGERVLDVGSGVGKLCILGSLLSEGRFVGVEQRQRLVLQARGLAAHLASTAEFVEGDAFDLDWTCFQAFYFFNPFDEARFPAGAGWQIDGSIPRGEDVFEGLVEKTRERLSTLAVGTRVVTFHGFGGPMPGGYRCRASAQIGDGALELWVRVDGL